MSNFTKYKARNKHYQRPTIFTNSAKRVRDQYLDVYRHTAGADTGF